MTRTRILAVLAAVVTAWCVSACSGGDTTAHSESVDHDHIASPSPVITGEPAGFDADDVTFATNMIPHHQQGVELAALVPDRSTDAEIIRLAQQIAVAQDSEVATLKVLLVQWKENPADDTDNSGHSAPGMAMAGMVDEATMAKLKALNGPPFDRLWLKSMIAHHQGAIEMAKDEQADGQNVDAKELAQNIVKSQRAEVDQMQKMFAGNP